MVDTTINNNDIIPVKLKQLIIETLGIDSEKANLIVNQTLSNYYKELMPIMAKYCPDAMFMHDLEGNILFVNELACKTLGYSTEELYNLKIWDIEVEWKQSDILSLWKEVVSKGQLTVFGKHIRKDQTVFPVELRLNGFESGGMKGILAIAHDITYRKNIEDKLLQSELEKRTILENIKIPIAYKDKENRFIWVNNEFCKLLQVTNQSIIGKTCSESIYNRDNVCDDCPVDTAIFTKLYKEIELVTKDAKHWIVSANPILDEKNEVLGVIEVIYNITEIKKAEEELLSLNAKKDKLFSIISHDLKGPLSSFLSLTEILVKRFYQFSLSELNNFNINLYESSKNIYILLSNLLQWSQLQLGNFSTNIQKYSLSELLFHAVHSHKAICKEKNISINVNIPCEYSIDTDFNIFDIVISNLINNAIKYSSRGGKIDISVNKINDNQIEVLIHDYGIGISEEILKHLFKIDKRIATKGTEGELGSGLGLILSKELLELLDLNLRIESQLNIGTTAYLTFNISS